MSTVEPLTSTIETQLQHHFNTLANFFAEKQRQCPDASSDVPPLTTEEVARINTLLYECTEEEFSDISLKHGLLGATPFKSATASFTTTTPLSKSPLAPSQKETPVSTRQKEILPLLATPFIELSKPAFPISPSSSFSSSAIVMAASPLPKSTSTLKPMTETAKFILQTLDASSEDASALPLPTMEPVLDTPSKAVVPAPFSMPLMPSRLRNVIQSTRQRDAGEGVEEEEEEEKDKEKDEDRARMDREDLSLVISKSLGKEASTHEKPLSNAPSSSQALHRSGGQSTKTPSLFSHTPMLDPIAVQKTLHLKSPEQESFFDLPVYSFAAPLPLQMLDSSKKLVYAEKLSSLPEASLPSYTF